MPSHISDMLIRTSAIHSVPYNFIAKISTAFINDISVMLILIIPGIRKSIYIIYRDIKLGYRIKIQNQDIESGYRIKIRNRTIRSVRALRAVLLG